MQSNRIWMISEERRQLLGRWKVEDGRLVREYKMLHPHVNGSGVCTGHTSNTNVRNTVLTALFLAMYPGDSFWGAGARLEGWLWDVFDHECPASCGSTAELAATCRCNYHRIARGEARCRLCGVIGEHTCTCPWCGCSAGVACPHHCPCDQRRAVIQETAEQPPAPSTECNHACCADCCLTNGCGYDWSQGDMDEEDEEGEEGF